MANKINGWTDLHSHFLPGIDDGCKTCDESAEVLRRSAEQGIQGIAATPHYYPKETIPQFVQRRQASYGRLLNYLEQSPDQYPCICLGAEVAYHSGLIYEQQLELLCYGSSRYMLLELPFSKWSSGVLRDVQMFRSMRGITPILAHLERYTKIQEKQMIESLYGMDVLIQMNAESYSGFWNKRKIQSRMSSGLIQVLGSDCHNNVSRPQNMGKYIQLMESDGLGECLSTIQMQNAQIFNAAIS